MKELRLFLVVITLLVSSCNKSKVVYWSSGYITGPDLTIGPDCHGLYFIRLENPTAFYTFDTLPPYSGIDLAVITNTNQAHVKLNWHHAASCNKIVIDDIERIK